VPKFVKKFGELGRAIEASVKAYAEEVRARAFPAPEHVYAMRAEGPGEGKPKAKKSKAAGS
jgi:3-methyl-2-oxobutanoate hydroxymethyltransferase